MNKNIILSELEETREYLLSAVNANINELKARIEMANQFLLMLFQSSKEFIH